MLVRCSFSYEYCPFIKEVGNSWDAQNFLTDVILQGKKANTSISYVVNSQFSYYHILAEWISVDKFLGL